MTTDELINYYANLLILQYIGKPLAYATVQALVKLVIMDQLPLAVQDAFNMDGTAQGVQLDVLGKYAGVTRNGFGLHGQPISLNDADFFTFIKMAGITNNAQSDLATIQNLLQDFFPGQIFTFDHKDMRMSYLIDSSVGSLELLELFITENLLPKPMGVQLAAPIYTNPLKFFGLVSARDVAAYAAQNSLSIDAAADAVAAVANIYPFNTAAAPITGVWLSVALGVAI
jgi:hypothetical protein